MWSFAGWCWMQNGLAPIASPFARCNFAGWISQQLGFVFHRFAVGNH